MLALFAVREVNLCISDIIRDSPRGLLRVSAIFERSAASGTETGELRNTDVAVNCTGCDIFAAETWILVVPAVCPNVNSASALPEVSVLVVEVLNFPLPAVMVNVTGTPANACLRSSRTSTVNGSCNAVLAVPFCASPDIFRSVVGVRLSYFILTPFLCIAGVCV